MGTQHVGNYSQQSAFSKVLKFPSHCANTWHQNGEMNNAKNNNESATATKRAITVNGKVKKLKRTQPAKK